VGKISSTEEEFAREEVISEKSFAAVSHLNPAFALATDVDSEISTVQDAPSVPEPKLEEKLPPPELA